MAAAAAESSWMPALVGPQRVEIGSSLRRALKARSGTAQDGALDQRSKRLPDNDYYSFRYRFRPATVDPHKTGTLEHRDGDPQYRLLRPSEKGDNVVFTGAERPAKDWDCVLIYDEVTGALSLEKIDSHFDWAHQGSAPSASAPSTNGAAAQNHTTSNTLALPLAAAPKPGPSRADALLAADLERELQDADASGESDHDFEPVAIPAPPLRNAKSSTSYASYPTEETFDLSAPAHAPPHKPGKGKGVARVEAAAAKAKPRGKKRKSTAEDDDFEPVLAPPPPPPRPTKRKKSSPPPPPPPPPVTLALPPRPAELLVPPPARPPPEYTSSEDEADMLEEVPIPPLTNGHGHANGHAPQHQLLEDYEFIEIDPSVEQNEDLDQLALELEQAMEGGGELEDDAQLADDIFGDMVDQEDEDDMEEATYGEEVQVNGNGYMNGHTNGHDPAVPLYPAYDDTSSDDSDDDDDD
ncbi:hypothetical protein AURDEDRAFT_180369 [Auricularia subglabra TFB-10046 SS5]|nr:hypothetical protein AURDEDRAFT_180369 [Auricularia subglabra TFB-10046 SS5]